MLAELADPPLRSSFLGLEESVILSPALENMLLGLDCCFASTSWRQVKHNSDPTLDSQGCSKHSNLAEKILYAQFPAAPWVNDSILFDERNTSTTTSHNSREGSPSIFKPATNEIVSDSVELWCTDVCFLHNQLMVTNVQLPKIHKIPPEVDFF